MADVTISQLTEGTPTGNNILPYSTGSTTLGVPVSAIFQNNKETIFKKSGSSTQVTLVNDDPGNGPGNKLEILQGYNSYITATQKLILTSRNSDYIILDGGNVGIGTAAPTAKLDVAGDVKATNTARAWVNFNGTAGTTVGSEFRCTIRDSYNILKVVRTNTGMYTIYFNTPLSNANYCITGTIGGGAGEISSYGAWTPRIGAQATTYVEVVNAYSAGQAFNSAVSCYTVFGS